MRKEILTPCANCGHTEPHTGPSAGGGSNDPHDACTHPGCECGYDSRRTPAVSPVVARSPELKALVQSLRRALEAAYSGSAEHGAFLRNGGGEYVPSPFMVLNQLEAALVPRPEPRACSNCGHIEPHTRVVGPYDACTHPGCACGCDSRPEPRAQETNCGMAGHPLMCNCYPEDAAVLPASAPSPPCDLCGGPHPFDTVVPSVRWNAVIRANGLPDMLCATCILQAFVSRGESFTADIDGVPFEVVVRSQAAIDADRLGDENTRLRAGLREILDAPIDAVHTIASRLYDEVTTPASAPASAPSLEQAVRAIVKRAGNRGTLTLSTVDVAELRALVGEAE